MANLIKIRQLMEQDWQIFSAVRLQALKECPGNFGANYENSSQFTSERWMQWLGDKEGAVFGLFNGSELIGITAVRDDKAETATGCMIASYIKPEYRGQGFSDFLNKARIDWAKAYKLWKKVTVSHREGNEASRRIYQRNNFIFTHRYSKTWPDGVTCDDVCYELDLEKLRESMSDLIIIGGGPGGYVAAIRAAQLGMKVTLVEREHMGGICLNWGCIPTKALLRSSEIANLLKHAGDFGFTVKEYSFDVKKIVERSRKVANQLSTGVKFLMKKNKVEVVDGVAKLIGKGKVEVTAKDGKKTELTAKNIIIATGARARSLPGLEPDGKLVWTYKEAMVPEAMPKSLLVVGSGAIGIEFASFYKTLGVDVTVIEVMDRILPVEDEEVSAFARKAFEKQGMKIITGATVKKLDKGKDNVTATIEQGGKLTQSTFDRVIMAIGITGNTENLGLEGTKVKVDRGHIIINEWCETGEPSVYAIGDVAGPPWLAHKASHEGVLCVEKIAGVKGVHPLDVSNVPGCTYCSPQVASVGMTEAKAKAAGHEIKVGRFPFIGNGKAIALGEPEGFVKTLFDAKTGELLGAHMIGPEVTELIQGYVIARTLETTETQLMQTIFAHPTISETMHEAVLDAYGRVIHM